MRHGVFYQQSFILKKELNRLHFAYINVFEVEASKLSSTFQVIILKSAPTKLHYDFYCKLMVTRFGAKKLLHAKK